MSTTLFLATQLLQYCCILILVTNQLINKYYKSITQQSHHTFPVCNKQFTQTSSSQTIIYPALYYQSA